MKNTILFFDDYMLLEYTNVKKRIFSPEKTHIIKPKHYLEYQSEITYIPESDVYIISRNDLDIEKDELTGYKTYESKDLHNWTRIPDEKIVNSPHVLQGFIMNDKFEPDPEKRYKAATIVREGNGKGSGFISTSPDALTWTEHREHSYSDQISDTQNSIFYNPMREEYQIIMRGSFVERRIYTATSKDMKTWSQPYCLMMTGPQDDPCTQYYGMAAFPMDGYFLGYLHKYHPPVYDSSLGKMAGVTDSHLVYSYDGHCWLEVSDRPLIERPLPPELGNSQLFLTRLNPAPDKTKWLVTGIGNSLNHACGFKPAYPDLEIPEPAKKEGFMGTRIHEIRAEGFAALESTSYESSIFFKSIVMHGEELFFNICAPLGWMKFQIHDVKGKVIPGFTFDDCIPFVEDDQIRYQPKWKEKSLKELIGKPIHIRVMMSQALIFAVTGDFYVRTGVEVMRSLGDARRPDMEIQY